MSSRIIISCLLLYSCKSGFVHQPSKANQNDVIPECKELVNHINNNWFRQNGGLTYKEFPGVFSFAQAHSDCLQNLHKVEILQILGEPTIQKTDLFEYIFTSNGTINTYTGYYYLRINFNKNRVSSAESGSVQGTD